MNDKYLVFYGERFYPIGGWEDFKGSFDTIEEAAAYIETLDCIDCWAHITFEGKIILLAEGHYASYDEYGDKYWKFKLPED